MDVDLKNVRVAGHTEKQQANKDADLSDEMQGEACIHLAPRVRILVDIVSRSQVLHHARRKNGRVGCEAVDLLLIGQEVTAVSGIRLSHPCVRPFRKGFVLSEQFASICSRFAYLLPVCLIAAARRRGEQSRLGAIRFRTAAAGLNTFGRGEDAWPTDKPMSPTFLHAGGRP